MDFRGNTPLMLAGKLCHYDNEYLRAVNILIDVGADFTILDSEQWSLKDIARLHKNRSLYSILFDHRHQLRKQKYQAFRGVIIQDLKYLPDCYFEVKWDLMSSFVPGIQKFLPSDTFKIWKYGANIRLDLSFVGMMGLKQKRRDITLLFRDGKSSTYYRDMDMVLLNREKETIVN